LNSQRAPIQRGKDKGKCWEADCAKNGDIHRLIAAKRHKIRKEKDKLAADKRR